MKSKIIQYLKSDRSFEGGVKLYQEVGLSMSLKTTLNRQGFTPYNHQLLLEELRKLAGISPEELKAFVTAPLAPIQEVIEKVEPVTDEEKQTFIREIPENIRKTIRLRDEFPFLGLPGCPNEIKILVADMITLHDNYMKAHSRLFSSLSEQDLQETAETVVEDYLENQQIWDELNYYKLNGKVLGNHKIFAASARIKEIQDMPVPDQIKLCNSLKSNITKVNKKLKEKSKDPKTADWKEKRDNYQVELAEVKRILGLNS